MCAFAPAAAMLRGLSTIPNKPNQLLGHSDCAIEGRQGRYPFLFFAGAAATFAAGLLPELILFFGRSSSLQTIIIIIIHVGGKPHGENKQICIDLIHSMRLVEIILLESAPHNLKCQQAGNLVPCDVSRPASWLYFFSSRRPFLITKI